MKFECFAEYLQKRIDEETANKEAMNFDATIQTVMNRFGDMPMDQQLELIKSAGYENHRDFAHALQKNPHLFQKVRIPGQKNYVGDLHKS